MTATATVHASVVLLGERGILIRGPSGSGKSALVLATLAANPTGAWLAADDRTALSAVNGRLLAGVPEAIAGLLEVRGQGIMSRVHVAPVQIHLVVDLRPLDECLRVPPADEERVSLAGVSLPRLALPIGAADGPARLRAALNRFYP